jgi:lysophospholipase L1-like esterase
MILASVYGFMADYLLWWILLLSLVAHTWCFFRLFPKAKRPRLRLVLGNVLVTLCLLGSAAIVGETYLRFLSIETDSFGTSLASRRWFLVHVDYNSWKCRDREWQKPKPEGVHRIAFVGDSYTLGWGVDRVEDRFTDLIAARLAKTSAGRVEVLNVAMGGWGTEDQVEPIRDIIDELGVNEVVLCFLPNDIEKLVPKPEFGDPTSPPQQTFFNPESSWLFDHLYRRVYTPFVSSVRHYHDWLAGGFADPAVVREELANIDRIVAICTERGVTLRVVLLPFIKTSGSVWSSPRIHAQIRAWFEERGVPVVDLLPVIEGLPPERLVVNAADAHPNVEAHRLFAERIWTGLFGGEPR